MSLILCIDTALEKAFAGISMADHLLLVKENKKQNEHAAFIQPAIHQMLQELNYRVHDIDAVGITIGPGSYTGLRVGMATAKGLCYALKKPLVAASTLEVLTTAAIEKFPGFDLYCPMIDARREEVYTAFFDADIHPVTTPHALILNEQSFAQELMQKKILFFGTGASKLGKFLHTNGNGYLENVDYNATHLAKILFNRFKSRQFLDLAYAEPFYIKGFYFGDAAKKLPNNNFIF
jgi:tRNA threonylcarbamoyladenosine biosynthesis protein TsaB